MGSEQAQRAKSSPVPQISEKEAVTSMAKRLKSRPPLTSTHRPALLSKPLVNAQSRPSVQVPSQSRPSVPCSCFRPSVPPLYKGGRFGRD